MARLKITVIVLIVLLAFGTTALVFLNKGNLSAGINKVPAKQSVKAKGEVLIFDANRDWSNPPSTNWPKEIPKLPSYKGWYHHLGVDVQSSGVGITRNLVVVFIDSLGMNGSTIKAFDINTGEERWSVKNEKNAMDVSILGDNDAIYVLDDRKCTALSAKDGTQLWVGENIEVIAKCGGKLWAMKYIEPTETWHPNDIAIIDSKTGQELKSFGTGTIYGFSGQSYAENSCAPSGAPMVDDVNRLVVKSPTDILVLEIDGTMKRISSKHPGWSAGFEFTQKGILMIEYTDPIVENRPQEGDYHTEMVLSLLNPETCKSIWNNNFKKEDGYGTWNGRLFTFDDKFIINKDAGFLGFNLSDGKQIFDVIPDYSGGGLQSSPASPLGIYCIYPSSGMFNGSKFGMLSPKDGFTFHDIDLGEITPNHTEVAFNALVVAGSSNPSGNFFWGDNTNLMLIKLAPNGLPEQGNLAIKSAPEDLSPVIDEFYKTKEPLKDNDLMTRVISTGGNGFTEMLKDIVKADENHLKALLALGIYINSKITDKDFSAFNAMESFFVAMRKCAKPELSPLVIEWLNDEALAEYKYVFVGLLALCGGEEAKKTLDDHYNAKLTHIRQSTKSPYKLVKPSKQSGTNEYEMENVDDVWNEFKAQDGTLYLAYISGGLASERDIYVAIDSNVDGLFEEILPTGLTDTYFYNIHPGGIGGLQKRLGPIKISVQNEKIKIYHHQPVLEKKLYDYGDRKEEYLEITNAKYVEDILDLNELRKDKDKDGLTDILEGFIFTDPNIQDTDSDGINDSEDPAPLTDDSKLDSVSRCYDRGLAFFHDSISSGWAYSTVDGHPWVAEYYRTDDKRPVSYTQKPYGFCIPLTNQEMVDAYHKKCNGYASVGIEEIYKSESSMSIGLYLSSYGMELKSIGEDEYPVACGVCSMS